MSETFGGNGAVPLTKEALADRTRFQFKHKEIDLSPEIEGVVLKVKTLSVAERDELPDLTRMDDRGNEVPDISIPKLAAVFAACVEEPRVTAEEAAEFLPDWPATALDKVIEAFGEMTGTGKEQKAAAGTFSGAE